LFLYVREFGTFLQPCFVGFRGNLHQIACEKWPTCSDSERTKMARMASAAAWGLG